MPGGEVLAGTGRESARGCGGGVATRPRVEASVRRMAAGRRWCAAREQTRCEREQVCARRAQEQSVTDGAGSAGAAERQRECGARAEVGGAGGAAERLRFGRVSDGTMVAGCSSRTKARWRRTARSAEVEQ
jgi:hypothetical protein